MSMPETLGATPDPVKFTPASQYSAYRNPKREVRRWAKLKTGRQWRLFRKAMRRAERARHGGDRRRAWAERVATPALEGFK